MSILEDTGVYSPEAERTILGTVLHVPDALDSIVTLKPKHFYDPKHSLIFDTIRDMSEENIPVTFMSLITELSRKDLLGKVGGRQYVLGLRAEATQLASLTYYSSIVTEKSSQRSLVAYFQKGLQAAQQNSGVELQDLLATSQEELDGIVDTAVKTDLISSGEALAETLDEVEALGNMQGGTTGVPTGFIDLDDTLSGLHPGQMIILAARPAIGKALDVDTPILTDNGWSRMGDLRPGMSVYGSDGLLTKIVRVSEVMVGRESRRLTFSDGYSLVADMDHSWNFTVLKRGGEAVQLVGVSTREVEVFAECVGDDQCDLLGLFVPAVHEGLVGEVPDDYKVREARRLVSVERVDVLPDVRCIEVAAGDSLFLAGRSLIHTHNSTLGLDFARSAALHNNRGTLMFSLEMSRVEITMRMLSAECRIPLQKLKTGDLDQSDWERISKKIPLIDGAPLFIDDTPGTNIAEIRAKARRFKQRNDLGLIIIDYLQLLEPVKRSDSREREVSEMSRAIKLLAKELDVPVVVMSQLNRGSEQRADKKPQVSDLRESGSLEQDADVVILLYREDAVDPESTRVGEADIIVGKQRSGPCRTVTVAFHGHLSRFANMARDDSARQDSGY